MLLVVVVGAVWDSLKYYLSLTFQIYKITSSQVLLGPSDSGDFIQ